MYKLAKFIPTLICYAVAVGYSLFSWVPLIDAKFGLIDDHEIVSFVGARERMPVSEFYSAWKSTEAASDSTTKRFRPSYIALRFVEFATWGKDAKFWYLTRIVISVFLAITIAYVGLHFAGPMLAFGFLIFTLLPNYWADIFARLGPGETYAVLGVCFATVATIGRIKTKQLGFMPALFASLGIIIATGSKENFLLILILPVWLLLNKNIKVVKGAKFLLCGSIAYILWVTAILFHRLYAHEIQTDIYSNDISINSRLSLIESFLLSKFTLAWFIITLVIFYTTIIFINKKINDKIQNNLAVNSLKNLFFVQLFFFVIYASQYFFYSGAWPFGAEPRYLFPGILFGQLAILFIFIFLIKMACCFNVKKRKLLMLKMFLTFCLIAVSLNNFNKNHRSSINTVTKTKLFNEKLNVASVYLKNNPSYLLIINSHDPFDYEPIFALIKFIKINGVRNLMMLNINDYSESDFKDGSLKRILTNLLLDVQKNGGDNNNLIPLNKASQTHCYSVGMSGDYLQTCKGGGITIWPY